MSAHRPGLVLLGATCAVLGACAREVPALRADALEPTGASAGRGGAGDASSRASALPGPVPIPDEDAFVPVAEQSFSSRTAEGPPGRCPLFGRRRGCWFVFDRGGNFAPDTASDAPASPPGVLSIRFPAGLEPGRSPGLVQGWSTPAEGFDEDYLAIREEGWVRVPSSTFEMQRVGVKFLGYVGVGLQRRDGLPIQLLFFHEAPTGGVTSVGPAANVNVIQQGFMDRKLVQNVTEGPVLTFGEWHHYAFLMVLNDVYEANGRLRVWMDGRLLLDYDDVRYRTPEHPGGFFGRRWDPVWGGGGGAPRSRDDHLQIDHIRITGVPMPAGGGG